MNVKEFKKLVAKIPEFLDHAVIVIQKDSGGNGYSPLSSIDTDSLYVPDSTWSGDVFDKRWIAEECCMDEDKWEKLKNNKKNDCVVLVPIN